MVEKGVFYVTIQTANGEDDIHNWWKTDSEFNVENSKPDWIKYKEELHGVN